MIKKELQEWKKLKFGDCAELVNGRSYSQHELQSNGIYQVIRIQNLNGGSNWYYSDLSLDEAKYCETGDLLFAWSATFGPYIWSGDKAIFHYHIWKILPVRSVLDREFAYYLLLWITERIRAGAHGIAMLHFTKEGMENFEVSVPNIDNQRRIATHLKSQFAAAEQARNAAQLQLTELTNLANAIIRQSVEHSDTATAKLGDVLDEVKKGVGKTWASYPVLGATRAGLALAREPVGKTPERYKPVLHGTVFYNPMRIMIGSIAMVDEFDTPGITSPDYVVLRGKPELVDSRWFYYWLRSPYGISCIASLARGAVRERMLFNRLAEGNIELPSHNVQVTAAKALAELKPMRSAIEKQLAEINLLPGKILAKAFEIAA